MAVIKDGDHESLNSSTLGPSKHMHTHKSKKNRHNHRTIQVIRTRLHFQSHTIHVHTIQIKVIAIENKVAELNYEGTNFFLTALLI